MGLEGLYRNILKTKHAIRQKAEDRINSLVQEYIPNSIEEASCPTPAELERIIAIREQIRQPLLSLNRKVEPLSNFLEKIPPILLAIEGVISVLKLLPIPNQFTTAGTVVTFGDTLASLKSKLKDFREETQNGATIIAGVNLVTQDILNKLSEVDALIEKCAPSTIEENPEFVTLLQSQNTNIPTQIDYKGYSIKIQEEQAGKLTKRYTVVYSPRKERIFTGNKSFSATTNILVAEAKFEIDKLLQQNYL